MSISPEEQYHQNIFDKEKMDEDSYIPKKYTSVSAPVPQINVTKYKILLKQGSQLNKKIIDYFKQNLQVLNFNKIVFEWLAVYEEEVEYYEEQGIDKFPVLIINDNNIAGVSGIIKTLEKIISSFSVKTKQMPVKPRSGTQATKDNDEEMHDFLLRELKSKDDKDDDDRDNISNTIATRVSSMNKSRKDNGLDPVTSSKASSYDADDNDVFIKPNLKMAPKPVEKKQLTTSELIKKTTKGDDEDKMMSQFWENQEETDM